jgi:hypothetical protein
MRNSLSRAGGSPFSIGVRGVVALFNGRIEASQSTCGSASGRVRCSPRHAASRHRRGVECGPGHRQGSRGRGSPCARPGNRARTIAASRLIWPAAVKDAKGWPRQLRCGDLWRTRYNELASFRDSSNYQAAGCDNLLSRPLRRIALPLSVGEDSPRLLDLLWSYARMGGER